METVKTYQHINRVDSQLSFGMFRMEDVYIQRKGIPDVPHRHNYFTVIFTNKAEGEHIIDFTDYKLQAHQVYFIAPGQVHQLIETTEPRGYGMTFSHEFLVQNHIPIDFIENLKLFQDFGQSPPIALREENHRKLLQYLLEMYQIHHSSMSHKYEAIGALLKLFLITCNHICEIPQDSFQHKDSLLSRFKSLVNEKYAQWHASKDYAAALHISPDHLNRIVKAQTGKTAKEHIQSRITVAAKRLLYFSSLSQKEIAYELGFSVPANFSAFFKHCTGMSPSSFKALHR